MPSFPTRQRPTRPVLSATNLPEAAEDDQKRRMRNYLISMGIRTFSFIAAIILWSIYRPLSVVFFVAAAILPYIAVVFANATGRRRIDKLGAVTPPPVPQKQVRSQEEKPQ